MQDPASALRAHSGAFEARQDLIAEIRQLIRVIDERNRDAAYTGLRQRDEVVGDPLRVSDKRQSAHSMHLETALFLEHFLTDARRRDVALRENAVDGAPIGVFSVAVAVVLLGLALCRSARDDADRVDVEVAAVAERLRLRLLHRALDLVERLKGNDGEERIAVADR